MSTLVYDGSFPHTNTSAGNIPDTAVVGSANAWVDSSTQWSIQSNLLHGNGSGTFQTSYLHRPTGESTTDQTIVGWTDSPITNGDVYGLVVRWTQGGTINTSACYYAEWNLPSSSGVITIYKLSGGNTTNLRGGGVFTPNSGHQYQMAFSAATSGANCILTITIYDVTTSTVVYTFGVIDSTSVLTTGVTGVDLNGTSDWSRIQTYTGIYTPGTNAGTNSITFSPSTIVKGTYNDIVATSGGSSWTGLTTFSATGGISPAVILTHNLDASHNFLGLYAGTATGTITINCSDTNYGTITVTSPTITINIVGTGDSRMFGTNATSGAGTAGGTTILGYLTSALGPNCQATNVGTQGRNLGVGSPSAISEYSSVVSPLYDATKAVNVLLLLIGINDIRSQGRTAAQVYADVQTYWSNARADKNWLCVMCSIQPADGSGFTNNQPDTVVTATNALLRANWKTFCDVYIDMADDPPICVAGAEYNSTYYSVSDFTHFTDALNSLIAQRIASGLRMVLGSTLNGSGSSNFPRIGSPLIIGGTW